MPFALGRRGCRLQHSCSSRKTLPLVQPRPGGLCDCHGPAVRAATVSIALAALELACACRRGSRFISGDWSRSRVRVWVVGRVLVTVELAQSPYCKSYWILHHHGI